MDKYTTNFIEYHIEKYSNSKKCDGCEKNKQFIESEYSLIYTCGDDGNGDCGVKIKINLIKYKDTLIIDELKRVINESINYDLLTKHFNIKGTDLKSVIDEINFLEEQYQIQNNIIEKEKLIKEIINQRKKLYHEKDINDPIEYMNKTKQMLELYEEALHIINTISSVIIVDTPKNIDIKKDDKKDIKDAKIEIKEIVKPVKEKINVEKNMKVKWLYRKKFKFGNVNKVNKKKSIIESNNSEYIVENDKLIIIEKEEYENNIKDIKELINVGSIVKWNDKSGNVLTGKIKKLNKVKASVIDSENNEYILPYTNLFI